MQIDFRQGIITYPNSRGTQTFLVPNGRFISQHTTINDRLELTFAHEETNYLVTENISVPNAWGPISANTDYWLYWDIDKHTASRTFGQTTLEPIISGVVPTGVSDQHWFDTTTNKMFVYQSSGWREVIRLFAAKVNNNKFTPLGISSYTGSQVGLTTESVAGRIILDELGVPIIQTDGTFLTTEDELYVDSAPINVISLETNVVDVTARENMAKFQVVKFSEFGVVNLAKYNDLQLNLIGLTLNDILLRQDGKVCLTGIITNPAWNYSNIGGFLWVTDNGLLTEINLHKTDPANHDISKLPIAQILSPTTILFGQGFGNVGETGGAYPEIPLATETVTGLASLSVPADNIEDPIMVETNDPRLIPYVHPTTHPATMITTNVYGFLTGLETQAQLQELVDRTLNSLSDVDVSSPSLGDALTWSGTAWIPNPVGITQYLANLSDVSLTALSTGQQLAYNGVVWTNVTPTVNLTGALTGTGTTSVPTTLATVNSNVGTFGDSTHVAQFTVNNKGLITSVTSVPITFSGVETGLTSIDVTSNASGLTYTNGPITTTGTIILSGILQTLNGGTSANTANDAFNNLAPSQVDQPGEWLSTDGQNTSWEPVNLIAHTPMYMWGDNFTTGSVVPQTSPIEILSVSNWAHISGGDQHGLGIKTDGTLWGWWYNQNGQLGDGTITFKSSPVQIGADSNWMQVEGAYRTTMAIRTDGTLWGWGLNSEGELGLDDIVNISSPTQIGSLTNWAQVSCTWLYSMAVKTDGTLWAWGNNGSGILGVGDTTTRFSPTQIGSLTDWAQVSCGGIIASAIKTDGTLWSWGQGNQGHIGDGVLVNRSSPVQVGGDTDWVQVNNINSNTTTAIKRDGTIWVWGDNSFGLLGVGSSSLIFYSTPVQLGTLSDWKHIGGGEQYKTAVKQDGTIWGWGSNINGQLANGTYNVENVSSPIQIGSLSNWLRPANMATGHMAGAIQFIEPSIVYPISSGGTSGSTVREAINALLPSQIGNAGKVLSTDGTNLIWMPKSSILP